MSGVGGTLAIHAERVFDGVSLVGPRRVEIADGRIVAVLEAGRSLDAGENITLPAGSILAPGFIDIQVNGGGDVLLNDAPTAETVARMAAAHLPFGTTGLLPTLITDEPERLEALAAVASEAMAVPGVLGFHLEGPHLNPLRKGIHPPSCIRPLAEADFVRLEAFGRHGPSLVTLAPELAPAGAVARLLRAGLRVAAGHSEATGAVMAAAMAEGLTGVTHLYNAMSQLTPREPGIVGAAMADERLSAGIIADGIHVAPQSLQAAFRAMGRDRLMLVTDAMPTTGGVKPGFSLQGRAITLKDGKLTDEAGTLAGAHLSMVEAVRNAVSMMGAGLADALAMASTTPARFLGLDSEIGAVKPGLRADLVALDAAIGIAGVWLGGRRAA